MTKLAAGRYQVKLESLTSAVSTAADKVFVDKGDKQRLYNRVMAEVDKTLVLLPVEESVVEQEHEEVLILDSSYRSTIESLQDQLKSVREYTALKIEVELFQQAWVAAHEHMDCAALMWSGWEDVMTRIIKFMDLESDGTPAFIMAIALQQWRTKMLACGIPDIKPKAAPYLHFHVEVLAEKQHDVLWALNEANCECLLNHLHQLGANNDRNRFLLTILSDIPARRVHNLLKIDSVTRVVGGKLDFSA